MEEKNETDKIKIIQKSTGRNPAQVDTNQRSGERQNAFRRKEIHPNPDLHISELQAKKIKEIVDKIIDINEKAGKFSSPVSKGKFYKDNWKSFYNYFGLTSYRLLPKELFDDAVSWLNCKE